VPAALLRRITRREHLEDAEQAAMQRLLSFGEPGEIFADVGAYHGAFARAAKARGFEVVCFEPDPANARHLRGLRVVEAVVSDNTDPVTFAARGSEVSGAGDFYFSDRTKYIVRPSVTLDAVFFNSDRRVGLLKVDVEGFEAKVMRGAQRVLQSARALLVEVHPPGMLLLGDDPESLRAALSAFEIEELDVDEETGRAHWLAVRSTSP
jgi:FkbM family methyltransferase